MSAVLDWKRPDVWQPWIAGLDHGCRNEDAASELRTLFDALRAFHAARPTNLALYYQSGIVPLTRERWHALVEECFLSQIEDPAITAAIVQAQDVQFDLVDQGRVHFCCDETLLEVRDGYHLIYGSLSLLAIAIQMDKRFGSDLKGALRRRGQPAIFVCDIPVSLIEDETLASLVAALRNAHANRGRNGLLSSPLVFHFSVPRALDAGAIVEHYRPRYVVDSVYGHDIREPESPDPITLR